MGRSTLYSNNITRIKSSLERGGRRGPSAHMAVDFLTVRAFGNYFFSKKLVRPVFLLYLHPIDYLKNVDGAMIQTNHLFPQKYDGSQAMPFGAAQAGGMCADRDGTFAHRRPKPSAPDGCLPHSGSDRPYTVYFFPQSCGTWLSADKSVPRSCGNPSSADKSVPQSCGSPSSADKSVLQAAAARRRPTKARCKAAATHRRPTKARCKPAAAHRRDLPV